MKSFERFFLTVIIFIAIIAAPALGQDVLKIATGTLDIQVNSVESAASFPAYVGSGLATAPAFSMGGGMSAMMMIADDDGTGHTYTAGKITANRGATLVKVDIEVKNISESVQSLRLGDIQMKTGKDQIDCDAVGFGEYAFAKSKVDRNKVKNETNKIEPNDTRHLVYIFAVPIESKWQMVYKGKKSVELKSYEKKAP